MKKQLYLEIKNRLKGITSADGEPLFRHFDLWNQQVEFIEQETPFQCPAIFIEFSPLQWQTMGNRMQCADLNVRLHIVTEWYAGTADYSPTEDEHLEYLDIVDSVVASMQGFCASSTNSWMRKQSIPNHNHERFVDSVEEYQCKVFDQSAVHEKTSVTASLNIVVDND